MFSKDLAHPYVSQTIRGWGSGPAEGLKRAWFDDEPVFTVREMPLLDDGFRFTFTASADPSSLGELADITLRRYWCKSHHYNGSPQQNLARYRRRAQSERPRAHAPIRRSSASAALRDLPPQLAAQRHWDRTRSRHAGLHRAPPPAVSDGAVLQ